MSKSNNFRKRIFEITSFNDFNEIAIEIFHYQYKYNDIYRKYVEHFLINTRKIEHFKQIPFLPIEFFKKHKVITGKGKDSVVFVSSGTTGNLRSKHYVTDINVYKKSLTKAFQYFYGNISDYCILALLPSYIEKSESSLAYMVKEFIEQSKHQESGFYLHDNFIKKLRKLSDKKQKILLIGLSYALLDIAEQYKFSLSNTIIMETGGMKGRRKEPVRQELHEILCKGFGIENIHSEYGMTELLSQAYSQGNGIFRCPPWMKVLIRDINDPLTIIAPQQSGGINVIDLANYNSCSFIATQDIGKLYNDESFEVLGRFAYSDVRGCNLMIS